MNLFISKLGLFWKVYLYGIFLLVSVVLVSLLIFRFVESDPPWHHTPKKFALLLKDYVDQYRQQPKKLKKKLYELHELFNIHFAHYKRDGSLVMGIGQKVPSPLGSKEINNLIKKTFFHRDRSLQVVLPINGDQGGYLLVRVGRGKHGVSLVSIFLGIILLLFLMPIPFARSLSRPLKSMASTASRLGQGDLSARNNFTPSKEGKSEVLLLADSMDLMASRLQNSLESERDLLRCISHELRTPLSRMRVALELCEEEDNRKKLRDHLKGITEDITELDNLIEDILLTSRLDQASHHDPFIKKKEVDGVAFFNDTINRFTVLNSNIAIDIDIQNMGILMIDPTYFRRVILNLLNNAVKYGNSTSPIQLQAFKQGNHFVCKVLDRGLGVEKAYLEKIFEPFFREDRSRSREMGGSGLGLSICQKIVVAHGGKISANLRENGGMKFEIEMPT